MLLLQQVSYPSFLGLLGLLEPECLLLLLVQPHELQLILLLLGQLLPLLRLARLQSHLLDRTVARGLSATPEAARFIYIFSYNTLSATLGSNGVRTLIVWDAESIRGLLTLQTTVVYSCVIRAESSIFGYVTVLEIRNGFLISRLPKRLDVGPSIIITEVKIRYVKRHLQPCVNAKRHDISSESALSERPVELVEEELDSVLGHLV